MDTKVLSKMKVADFDQNTIRGYKFWLESKRPGHVFLSQSNEAFLESIGAARITDDGVLHPTSAGLLMFGKEYKILYEFELHLLDYCSEVSSNCSMSLKICRYFPSSSSRYPYGSCWQLNRPAWPKNCFPVRTDRLQPVSNSAADCRRSLGLHLPGSISWFLNQNYPFRL